MDVVSGGGGPRKRGRDSGKGVATWPTQGTEIELVTAGGSWDGPTRSFRGVGRASRNRPLRADGENAQPLASVTRRSRVGRRVPAAMTARWPRPASRLMASEKPQAEDLTCDAILRALWPQSDTSAPRSPRPAGASCSVQCITDPSRDSSRLEAPPKPVPTAHGHEWHRPPTPATSCHSASPAACVGGGGGDPDLGPRDTEPYPAVAAADAQSLCPLLLLARPCDRPPPVPAREPSHVLISGHASSARCEGVCPLSIGAPRPGCAATALPSLSASQPGFSSAFILQLELTFDVT